MRALFSLAATFAAVGCGPDVGMFEIQGAVYPGALDRGSILALWTLRTEPAQLYKWGDGSSVETVFVVSFDEPPPPGAIDADGIGVATLVQLPEHSTIPDGIVNNPDALRVTGASAEHAVIFKRADATGPAWAANFGLSYSCAKCVRSTNGGLDTFELTPCLDFSIYGVTAEPCHWY